MATAMTLPQEHSVWDCRWSSPGHRITGYSDALQPEQEWVCEHDGDRRPVTNAECLACARWEAAPAAVPVPMHLAAASLFGGTAAAAAAPAVPLDGEALQRLATRMVLVLIALLFAGVGVVVLSSPIAVPFTVAMFLCAAALVGWAILLPGIGGRD